MRIVRRAERQSTRQQDTSSTQRTRCYQLLQRCRTEVPDATENLNNEFKRVKESGEQFFGVRDVLEQLNHS